MKQYIAPEVIYVEFDFVDRITEVSGCHVPAVGAEGSSQEKVWDMVGFCKDYL